MSKRKPLDKAQMRQRRNQMLESAAATGLPITEGVREMRAIAGMTQEEFARHREVSARVIKAIELGQGNPTLATMNQIAGFFGLEVAFVPIRRAQADEQPGLVNVLMDTKSGDNPIPAGDAIANVRKLLAEAIAQIESGMKYMVPMQNETPGNMTVSAMELPGTGPNGQGKSDTDNPPPQTKKKRRSAS